MKALVIILIIIGLLLIGIGVYSLTIKSASQNASETPSSSSKTTPTNEYPGWKEVKRGSVSVDEQWQYIGKYSGNFLIVMSGTATLDPNKTPISPDGISVLAPKGFTVPGIAAYCSLAKVNGNIQKVGTYRELWVNGELYLGVNEDAEAIHGNSFSDNTGVWNYRILMKE